MNTTTAQQQQIISLQNSLNFAINNNLQGATSSILKKIHSLELEIVNSEATLKRAYKALDSMVEELTATAVTDSEWSSLDTLVDDALLTTSFDSLVEYDVWGDAK
jgi:exonuclease VII large subunit